jgi:hypothetical protein
VIQIRQRLKEAQNRQKSYADAHRTDRSYEVGDQVFIRIRPNKSTIRLGRGKSCHHGLQGHLGSKRKLDPLPIVSYCHPTCIKLIMYFMYMFYVIMLLMNDIN